MMATDKDRRIYFNDKTAESVTRRMHIKHCFDFVRAVRAFSLSYSFYSETLIESRIFFVRQTRLLSLWIQATPEATAWG